MAIFPKSFTGQDRLQPGGRGELFSSDFPGYRGQGDRINRTNETLNTSAHDVTNISYAMDSRLPVLFRYGWGYGFNQIVMTKGTIVAIEPHYSKIDFEDKKPHNILTIANGGKNIKPFSPSKSDPKFKRWEETTEKIDIKGGKIFVGADEKPEYRAANKPIGIIMRNEYTRNDDAFNGMDPGAVLTDCLVELPWFHDGDKALNNPWGCAYGKDLKPGDLVKSDVNGKFIKSPLSDESTIPTDIKEYEKERQQVIGEIYETKPELIPAGAAIYAQWALKDRMNFEDFNPETWRGNNRDGEDLISNSPYQVDGGYPGYPYEKGYMAHDLHMISQNDKGGRGGVYDPRLQLEYQMRNGIPGLTDGYNAYVEDSLNTFGGSIAAKADKELIPKGTKYMFRTLEVDLEKLVASAKTLTKDEYDKAATTKLGDEIEVTIGSSKLVLVVDYVDLKQGIVSVATKEDFTAAIASEIKILFSYSKRGKSGVPTNLDWDGCKGTIKILLQK